MVDVGGGVVGVILAGGEARRMGGGDKTLKPLGGRPILAGVVERLAPQVGGADRLALSANGDPARFEGFDLPVLADPVLGEDGARLGPLAGVLAALEWAEDVGAAHVVSVAGDTPFFPQDLASRLAFEQGRTGAPIVLAASPDQNGAIWDHPTFGLWSAALAPDLRKALVTDGVRKIVRWTDAHGAARAAFPRAAAPNGEEFDPFFNVNTPEDLAAAQRISGLDAIG